VWARLQRRAGAESGPPAQGKPVAAAVLRVFGPQLAEVPLVATRHSARRQGHARVLMRAIEVRAPPARPPRPAPRPASCRVGDDLLRAPTRLGGAPRCTRSWQ